MVKQARDNGITRVKIVTDIVKRLRMECEPTDGDMETAADRIEALEGEIKQLKHELDVAERACEKAIITATEAEYRAAEAEAREAWLRVALEKIEQGDYERIGRNFYNTITRTPSKHDTCWHGEAYWDDCGNCCSSFARKALEDEEP
jgi:phage shock protein A